MARISKWMIATIIGLTMLTVTLSCIAAEAGAAAKKGWTKLGNGRDLEGWEKANTGGSWTVENGIIIARRTLPDRGASWLVTKKDYGDFILRLKYKSAYEHYNSGILI
ncbi:MAG: 3-keto-disaccharide hydrolase, partial [Bryobacteraceae bacterium]